jgi:hypothetical protein
LQNSGISSRATASANPLPAAPARRRFSLKGVSAQIDPRIDAVRGDLADVRLADRVFAPHYAAPLARTLMRDTALRAARACDSAVLAQLSSGGIFEMLELSAGTAWGVAPAAGLVGYIDAAALGETAA